MKKDWKMKGWKGVDLIQLVTADNEQAYSMLIDLASSSFPNIMASASVKS